jgi:predicted amidohydrolase YtcJ
VIASVQPYHAIDDGKWAERRIGPERARTTFAFRSFLDHGIRLAAGAAYAEFAERDKVTIAAGRLADLVLLSEDPFRIPPDRLRELRAVLTVAGGTVVYERR